MTPNVQPVEAGVLGSAWRMSAGGAMAKRRSVSGVRSRSPIAVSWAAKVAGA
jgi:hypothetical protein